MVKVVLLLALRCSLALATDSVKGSDKIIYNFQTTDFSEVLKTTYFVDKTLLIKDFMASRKPLYITAPSRFGKSVIIDMVKRFLEIQVDENGMEVMNKTNTSNYKLFTNLNIYQKHTVFFNLHFGTYPVVHIDFSPLKDIVTYKDMLHQLRTIVLHMYREHSYLLHVKSVWQAGFFLEDFKDFIIRKRNKRLDQQGIDCAFKYLLRVLFRHFRRPVVTLVDNYDSFAYSFIHRYQKDKHFMVHMFMGYNSGLLLYGKQYVCRSLSTGVLKATGDCIQPCCVFFDKYFFLSNHTINKYLGLTEDELDQVLFKTTDNSTKREELKTDIDKYYTPYVVLKEDFRIYNMWSVLHYLKERRLENYWIRPEFFESSTELLDLLDFQDEVMELLQGGNFHMNISFELTREHLFQINTVYTRGFTDRYFNEKFIYRYFYMHYQSGCLCLQDKNSYDEYFSHIKIPSLEIKSEYFHVVRDAVINKFTVKLDMIENINSHLSLISENIENDNVFYDLYLSFYRFFIKSNYNVNSETDLRRFLFLVFRCEFTEVYYEIFNRLPNIGSIDIVVKNYHDVTIFIEVKLSDSKNKQKLSLLSKNGVDKMIGEQYISNPIIRAGNKVVHLGLCLNYKEKLIGFSYSKSLRKGHNLHKVTVLSTQIVY